MKINRIVSLLLVLALMLGASAFAEILEWSFARVETPQSEEAGDALEVNGYGCCLYISPDASGMMLADIGHGETVYFNGGEAVDENGVAWCKVSYEGESGWIPASYVELPETVQAAAPAPTAAPAQNSELKYIRISGGDCSVRSAGNLSGQKIGTLYNGQTANYRGNQTVDDRGVIWYEIEFNGGSGWVSSKYAKLSDGSTPAYVNVNTGSGYVKATSYKVNIRSTAGLGGEDIGTMREGQTATWLGQKSTDYRGVVWYKVRFNGETGWVSSKYSKLYTY